MIMNTDIVLFFLPVRIFFIRFLDRKCLAEFNFQNVNVRMQLNFVTSPASGGEK